MRVGVFVCALPVAYLFVQLINGRGNTVFGGVVVQRKIVSYSSRVYACKEELGLPFFNVAFTCKNRLTLTGNKKVAIQSCCSSRRFISEMYAA
jgi:hypothetical protein